MKTPTTLIEAIRYFSDPDVCFRFVSKLRWPKGPICPQCGGKEHGFLKTRRIWKCKAKGCRKQFSLKKGSIFEDSALGLDKWLAAMWLISSAKNGVSSYEIHRAIGVTQKTAWFMLHRIRLAMRTGSFEKPLGGQVEADESYIGGKTTNMHMHKLRKMRTHHPRWDGKAIVMGLLERDGEVRTQVIDSASKRTLQRIVRENVRPGAKLFTDQLPSYIGLERDYAHRVINHLDDLPPNYGPVLMRVKP